MAALDGLTVLDLTRVLGGPYCTMLLADMGADVVKVEPPGGDPVRETPPFAGDPETDPYGGYFQSVNRGKQSLALDLTDEDDRAAFLDLVDRADVLVENYRPGTMERFGLGYERLAERNPGLVYAAIRGFGDPRTGATDHQDQPTFDLVVQAMAGVMQVNGQPDDPPTKVGLGVGDIFTGVCSAVGILAAVHHRDRTGEGQFVDTSMYDSMLSLAERAVYQYSYTSEVPGRDGNSHPTLFPYDAFEASDGLVVIAAIGENHWTALCEAMDRPDLATYRTQAARLERRDELTAAIASWTSEHTTADVLAALEGDVPCAPVRDVADVFADGVAEDRGMLVDLDQPGTDERVTVAGTPVSMTATPPEPGGRAPLLDEHRDAILGRAAETSSDGTEAAGGEVKSTGDGTEATGGGAESSLETTESDASPGTTESDSSASSD